jgi:hypothetical protein
MERKSLEKMENAHSASRETGGFVFDNNQIAILNY